MPEPNQPTNQPTTQLLDPSDAAETTDLLLSPNTTDSSEQQRYPQPRVRSHVFRSFIDTLPPGIGAPPSFVANNPGLSITPSHPPRQPGTGAPQYDAPGSAADILFTSQYLKTAQRSRAGSQLSLGSTTGNATVTYPLIVSTTDVRTSKVTQLLVTPTTEVVWWIDGTKQQFRIMGRVRAVPSPQWTLDSPFTPTKFLSAVSNLDINDTLNLPPAAVPVKSEPVSGQATRTSAQGSAGALPEQRQEAQHPKLKSSLSSPLMSPVEWHDAQSSAETTAWWEAKRRETFLAMSAHMKASWCRPVPGSPLSLHGGPEAAKRWPVKLEEPTEDEGKTEEGRENKRNWEEALKNFALLVIEPFEVDLVDLGVVPNRRWRFWVEGGSGGVWKEEELVP